MRFAIGDGVVRQWRTTLTASYARRIEILLILKILYYLRPALPELSVGVGPPSATLLSHVTGFTPCAA